MVKRAFKAAPDKLESVAAKLTAIHQITSVQAEKHLWTIQNESIKHTKPLQNIMTEQKAGLAELNGSVKMLCDVISKKI
jgi:hypothetical protein